MSFVVDEIIVELWTILDVNSDPLTGMTEPTDIEFTLHRQSGSAMIAASETITFAEIGSTGHYSISFTPENTGLYVLQLKELHASTLLRTYRFPDMTVLQAGAVFLPSFANSYCSEADIERWLNQSLDSGTTPSATEAAAFAEVIASVLSSMCASWGLSITPTTVTAGSRLEDIMRDANAVGAAMHYVVSQQYGKSPSRSNKGDALEAVWYQFIGDPTVKDSKGYLEKEVRGNLASLATDHILSGDTAARVDEGVPVAGPIGIGMGDLF